MKRFYLYVLCILVGVGGFVWPALAKNGGADTIVYAFPANVGPLNPHMYSPNQMFAQEMVYEPLVQWGESGQVEPALAQSWDVSDDGLVYTFHLRSGVTFSDGTPFNAQAVVMNFKAVMDNAKRHDWLPIVGKIESYEAKDDMTFVLTLNAPYYPALEDLSLPRPFRFLSPSAFLKEGDTQEGIKAPIGTGPWKLVETKLGEYDLFERNESYWRGAAQTAYVQVKVIPDPTSRAFALNAGEVDLIYGSGQVSYDTFNALRHNPAFTAKISQPMGGMAIAINSNLAPTNELAVRQALQYATHKAPIIEGVFLGSQVQAETLFSPSVNYCNVGLKPYAFDQAKAKEILDNAGWILAPGKTVRERDGQRLEIDFYYMGSDAAEKAIAEILQAQFAQVGIALNIRSEEQDSFYRRQKEGNFGMVVNTTWGPPFEPHAMLGSMRYISHADYQAQIGLPMKAQIDSDITRVLETQDEGERQAIYRQILTTLHEQAVYLPIYYNSMLLAYRTDKLEGVHFGPGMTDIPFRNFIKKIP